MSRIGFGMGMIGVLAAGAAFVCGCGQPEGAGTVNMTAIKAEAARRGIPEAKGGDAAKSGARPAPGGARGKAPAKPLPKGGR